MNKKKVLFTVLGCCFVVAAAIFTVTTMKDNKDRAAAGLSRMNNPAADESDQMVGMVNPMKEVNSSADFSSIGVVLDAPEKAENVQYYVVGGNFAEIICDIDGQPFTFRGQKDIDGQQLSGIYGDWIASNRYSEAQYYMVGTEDRYYVAIWEKDGVTYVASTTSSEEKLAEVVEKMIK